MVLVFRSSGTAWIGKVILLLLWRKKLYVQCGSGPFGTRFFVMSFLGSWDSVDLIFMTGSEWKLLTVNFALGMIRAGGGFSHIIVCCILPIVAARRLLCLFSFEGVGNF